MMKVTCALLMALYETNFNGLEACRYIIYIYNIYIYIYTYTLTAVGFQYISWSNKPELSSRLKGRVGRIAGEGGKEEGKCRGLGGFASKL